MMDVSEEAALRREMDGYLRRGLTSRADEVAALLRDAGSEIETAATVAAPAKRRKPAGRA